MTPALTVVHSAGPLHRLGRRPDPWAWPDWAYAGPDGTFGNRYDDPESEFRVLYASSDRLTCFLETLARFRPDPEILAATIVPDPRDAEFPSAPPGRVPASWPENRVLGTIRIPAWPFVDVGTRTSLAHPRVALAGDLARLGIGDLDGATLRSSVPRTLTQRIARLVYDRAETTGVRYLSRLGDDGVNWAIQEPVDLPAATSIDVEGDDPDFLAALELFSLSHAAANG